MLVKIWGIFRRKIVFQWSNEASQCKKFGFYDFVNHRTMIVYRDPQGPFLGLRKVLRNQR